MVKPRRYLTETIWSQYANAHRGADIELVANVIKKLQPDYVCAMETVFNARKMSPYNMFVMRAELFDLYMTWLFEILFTAQKSIPFEDYGPYQKRVFGFLAERLFNVWIEKMKGIYKVKYLPVVNIEDELRGKKAMSLFCRKFFRSV